MNITEKLFQKLFTATPHPYLILNADQFYTIVEVNDYYLEATGIVRENVIGHPLFEIFPDNPKDETVSGVSDLHISLDSVVRYGKTDMMGVQKYDIPKRDGSGEFEVKYWSPVNVPVFDENGQVEYIIHNVEDVTDFILLKQEKGVDTSTDSTEMMRLEAEVLKRANEVKEANRIIKARENELAVLNDKLKELDRLKTEFFSNISHEFRTPLTLMLAPIEELLSNRHNITDERIASNLEIAHRNLLRLLKLVNTLLDFSRIEAGRVKASFESTDISALTADLASNFSSASELAKVKLIVDCPPLKEWIEVDHDMWEKIVLNLLSNAFKFTHEGTITVCTCIENNQAVLRISDTGIGISQEELPKLFERFYRVENSGGRTYEGTGIGLSLVQELVKLQGGTIDVSSELGKGTTFSVFMPLGIKHETTQSQPKKHDAKPQNIEAYIAEVTQWSSPKSKETSQHSHNISKGRILVADDNPDMREFIKRLLDDAGYDVLLASDGEEAWQICMNNLPDLILSDVMMPRLNGFELIKKIRSADYTYSLPIILISARAGEVDKAEGLISGADDYLSKPFHSAELIARVDAAVKLGGYRKRAHEELLKTTNQIAKIGGWSFDVETMKGEWTEELIRIHDLPPNEPIDVSKGLDFYTPQSRPIIEQAVQDAIALGKPYDLQLEIISATGVHKWIRTVGTPVIHEGKVVKVQGVMQDITEQKQSEKQLHDALIGTIQSIAGIVEMRDPYTAGHEKRVALLACAIAKEMGLDDYRIEGLQLAAEIHDLGKVQIPAEILVKPTRLSELEYKMIQMHPEAGYEILKDIDFPWPIAEMILQHHEKLDGSGYPRGLKGDEILLEARILCIADIVESMASHRPYRPALGIDVALDEIQQLKGTKLDTKVVDICVALFQESRFVF